MKRKFHVTQYAIIFDKGKLLLLRDAVHDVIKGRWVFPGGHVDLETDPIKALKRELKEELGMDLREAKVFATAIKKWPYTHWKYIVYYKCIVEGRVKLSHEHSEYKWTSLHDMKNMSFRDKHEKDLIKKLLDG